MSQPGSLVREYMTENVVAVSPETPLPDVMRVILEKDVSCVLVSSGGGKSAGVISLTDLLRAAEQIDSLGVRDALRIFPKDRRASDIMQASLVAVDEGATIGEAASRMLERRVHRLFVTRNGTVVGVFSTKDAMRVIHARQVKTPVSDVMTKPVETISIGAPIDDALERLSDANLRGLVVIDRTQPVGLFTQLEAIRARAIPTALRRHPVEELMSYEMLSLDAATPLYRAAGHAAATRVRRILVTEGRTLAGIVTGYDLARALIEG